jgi:hypothetical protein
LVFQIIDPSLVFDGNAGHHHILLFDPVTENTEEVTSEVNAGLYLFTFDSLSPAAYIVIAGSDPDNDGFVCGPGEACAVYPMENAPEALLVNRNRTGIDFDTTYMLLEDPDSLDGIPSSSRKRLHPGVLQQCKTNLAQCMLESRMGSISHIF